MWSGEYQLLIGCLRRERTRGVKGPGLTTIYSYQVQKQYPPVDDPAEFEDCELSDPVSTLSDAVSESSEANFARVRSQ
jgi:hypothetical protein